MYKEVGWKQRQSELDPLPVFPASECLVGGKVRLDPPQTKLLERRFFVLRDRIDGVPIAIAGAVQYGGVERSAMVELLSCRQ